MPIVYALVAREKTILAEYTSTSGNFPTITRVLLTKISSEDTKRSYQYDSYVFHYLVRDGVTFMCMADESSKRRIPFAFLDDIKKRFETTYGSKAKTAAAFSMNEDFGRELKKQMEFFNSDPSADSVSLVKSQVDGVKNIVVENIEKILERGEKIELLVDKTDRLNEQALKFEESSQKLKRVIWLRKMKLLALLTVLSLVMVYVIVGILCGFDFSCASGKKSE